jgi:DNA-binding NarL/FixJ family response regulator
MSTTALPIRVLLITEHTLVREGLCLLLESQPGLTVVAATATDAEALAAATREHPDIVLLDVDRGRYSDFTLVPELLAAVQETRVLILTDGCDPEVHQHAVRLGAMGLVMKDSPPAALFRAMEKVCMGEVWFGRRHLAQALRAVRHRAASKEPTAEAVQIASLTPHHHVLAPAQAVLQLTGQISPQSAAIGEQERKSEPQAWEPWADTLPRVPVETVRHPGGLTESPRPPGRAGKKEA